MLPNMIEMEDNQYIQMYTGDDFSAAPKKRPPRRNPWGNSSYADLITQAIETSPEKKLTLSQIYDWMIRNIPHFSNQGASNSSAGWKNSIRHNLSLHEKFLRIKNEDTNCKSSWWTVNKSGGTGRTTRRKNLSRRKKSKGIPQKANAFFQKFSVLSSTKQSHSPNKFESSLQNIPNISTRRWQSCSSNSSEENESFHSLSESNSPSSVEGEIVYRDPFCGSHSIYTPITENQPLNGFCDEFGSAVANFNLQLNSDIYNCDQLNAKGVETCYSLGNRFYSHYDNQHNPSSENYLKTVAVGENSSSTVSREYFKSPHHLSGSYMTSEYAEVNKIQTSLPGCENFISFELNNFRSHIQDSPVANNTFNMHHKSLFVSTKPPNLIQLPLNSRNPIEVDDNVDFDIIHQNPLKDTCLAEKLYESHLCFKKKIAEESERKNECFENQLQCFQELAHKLKFNTRKEEADASGFKEMILNHDQKSVHTEHNSFEKNPLETASEITSVLQSTSIPGQDYFDLQSISLTDNADENIEMRRTTSRSPKCITTQENVTELIQQPTELNDQISATEKEGCSGITDDYKILQEAENDNKLDRNRCYVSCDSSKTVQQSNVLQANSYINSTASVNLRDENMSKRKIKDEDIQRDRITHQSSKRQIWEFSETKSRNSEAVETNTQQVLNNKESRKRSIEMNKEMNTKVKNLLSHMVNLVLQKVESVSYTRFMADHTLNTLYQLSGQYTPKQLLCILVEFLYALDATYVCQITDTQVFHNYNYSLEVLLRSHYDKCLSLKDAIDLYLRVIPDVISVYFSEKVLSDSRITDMDIPMDINLFLRTYQLDVNAAVTDRQLLIIVKDQLVLNSEKQYSNFILPSICSGTTSKSSNSGFNAVNDLDDLNIFYERSYNEEFCASAIVHNQQRNQDIPQYFLDALQLQRIDRINSTFVNYIPQCKTQNKIDGEDPESYYSQKYCIAFSDHNSSKNQNMRQLSIDSMQFHQKNIVNNSVENDEPDYITQDSVQNMDVENTHEETEITNYSLLVQINDIKIYDILPDDLRDVELLCNFEITDDYLDFEFCKYDFSFDNYLNNSEEHVKSRQ